MSTDELSDRVRIPLAPSAFKAGLVLAAVSLAFSLILYFTGNATNNTLDALSFPILIFVIYYFTKKFRDEQQDGYITFGRAFGFGFLMCLVNTVVSSVYTYFLFNSDPSLKEEILNKTYNDMIESGTPDAQIEQAIEMTEKFLTPGMMVFWAILFGLILSAVFSLISAAIVKRKHPLD